MTKVSPLSQEKKETRRKENKKPKPKKKIK